MAYSKLARRVRRVVGTGYTVLMETQRGEWLITHLGGMSKSEALEKARALRKRGWRARISRTALTGRERSAVAELYGDD